MKSKNNIADISDTTLNDYLKASINMEDIEVSEDLVQRTLHKLKQPEMNVGFAGNKKKNLKVYVSAAAAIVLVVASISVWQGGLIGRSNQKPQVQELEQAAPNAKMNSAERSSTTESIEDSSNAYDSASKAKSAQEASDSSEFSSILVATPLFSMTYGIDSYSDVTSFVVTNGNKESVSVMDKGVKTEELYHLLNQYEMSQLTEKLNENWVYKADITLSDKSLSDKSLSDKSLSDKSLSDLREIIVYVYESGTIAVSDLARGMDQTYYSLSNGKEFLEKFSEFYTTLN